MRLDTLQRIGDQLAEICNRVFGQVDRTQVDEYHHQLDRLKAIGEDVDEFYVRESDWEPDRFVPTEGAGSVGTYRLGPLRGNEQMIVHQSRFESRFRPAFRFVQRRIQEEQARMEFEKKLPGDILAEQSEILARFIDAYLRNQSTFLVIGSHDGYRIEHPGLTEPFYPNWAHVEALAAAGKLHLKSGRQSSTWKINIPIDVLRELAQRDRSALDEQDSGKRVKQLQEGTIFQNFFFGGSQNVAQASSDFSQTITQQIQPGDRESLFTALRRLGLDDDDLSELEVALEADEEEAGKRHAGTRTMAWLGGIANKAVTQVATAELTAGLGTALGRVEEIRQMLVAFNG